MSQYHYLTLLNETQIGDAIEICRIPTSRKSARLNTTMLRSISISKVQNELLKLCVIRLESVHVLVSNIIDIFCV